MLDGRELVQRRNSSSGNYAKGRKSLSLEPFPGLSAGHRRWSAAVRVVPAVGFPQYEGFTTFESSPPVEKSPPSGFAPRVVPAFREVSAGGVRRSSRSRSRISEVRGFHAPRVVPAVRVRRSRSLPSFDLRLSPRLGLARASRRQQRHLRASEHALQAARKASLQLRRHEVDPRAARADRAERSDHWCRPR